MIDVGMVQYLTSILRVIDLDHPDSPKVVNLILKALESLARVANASEQKYSTRMGSIKKNLQVQMVVLKIRQPHFCLVKLWSMVRGGSDFSTGFYRRCGSTPL
uniref:Uncharacterized protein n=1 Tax=Nelumbo nucifera TaxID=4432 RepID=A0A822XI03_NELNU|nr:TPA_asm: hypothetical protein HUJ06_022597 [Nelumbo nucifera]